ncbi:trypsin-like peptidase domain-containing protein [Streptomyces sp. NPDC050538]|uniref:serine protease n=1 Tax=Streptomyces sp. NPDC050538 TaxID=3365627 RepID=UPI00379A63FF
METYAELSDGTKQAGTGYLIADRVMLTARHVVVDSNGNAGVVTVRGMDRSADWITAKVVWTPADTTIDVALLELDTLPIQLPVVRWGRIEGGPPREVSGIGFPRRQDRGRVRHSDHFWGQVTVEPRRNALSVDVGSSTQRAPDMRDSHAALQRWDTSEWSGVSGAALFCGPLLVGVVSSDAYVETYDGRKLHGVPVTAFWGDPDFTRQRERLGLHTHTYPVLDPNALTPPVEPLTHRTEKREDLHVAMSTQIRGLTAGWNGVQRAADRAIDLRCRVVGGESYAEQAQAVPITHDTIVDYYRALSPRRLVITGPSGSGKTILVLRLMRQLLDHPGLPIPVYFNLAAWELPDPKIRQLPPEARPKKLASHFEDWLARQLVARNLVLSLRDARRMVQGRDILPVLDGMDQIPAASPPVDAQATRSADGGIDRTLRDLVDALNGYLDLDGGQLAPLVLATRSGKDFETETRDIPLPEGAVVEVERLTWVQIQQHLESGEGPPLKETDQPVDWQPVLDDLTRNRGEAVAARRLDTPWKLTLAVWAAASQRVTPEELIAGDTSDAEVEERLLASFVPSVHGYHSVHNSGTSGKSPEQVMGWLSVLAGHLRRNQGTVHGMRLSGREVILAQIWPVAEVKRVRKAHTLVHTLPIFFFGMACVIAAVSGLGHAADFFRELLDGNLPALTRAASKRLTAALLLATALLAAGVYFARRYWPWMPPTHWPLLAFAQRRTQGLRTRRGPRRILSGLEIGSAIGLGVGMACTLAFGWWPGVITGVAVAAFFGWFMERKVGLDRTLSGNFNPEFFWVLDALAAVVFAGLGALVFPILEYRWIDGLVFGACFGFALGFGFGLVPWLRYTTAMTLATRDGLLPWRLAAFLDWASKAGLMTISGVGFQFRHQELQEWFTDNEPPYKATRVNRSGADGGKGPEASGLQM